MTITLLAWAALVAQQPDSAKVARFQAPLDSVDVALDVLRGALARFSTDLPTTSRQLVLDRAAGVQRACTGGVSALQRLHQQVTSESFGGRAVADQRNLVHATATLISTLQRCQREWTASPASPVRADSLRAWGPYRSRSLNEAVRIYTTPALTFRGKTGTGKPPRM